jgi:hypothetical protein
MKKRNCLCALGFVLLVFALPSPGADVHSAFKAWTAWYGRETTVDIESWISADREYHKTSKEILIIRRDLGVRWRLNPADKTYVEYPLAPGAAPSGPEAAPGPRRPGGPEGAGQKEDLRFAGGFDEPVLEWTVRPLEGTESVKGFPCRLFSIRGDADFASTDVRVWVLPSGKADGLAAPAEILGVFRWDEQALEQVEEVLAGFPDGGLLKMTLTADPPIGDPRKGALDLEAWDKQDPPAGIYEIPSGYKKVERKKS